MKDTRPHLHTPEMDAKRAASQFARRKPLAERYWPKVDKRGPDECWPWIGSKNSRGYGEIYPGPGLIPGRKGPHIGAHVAAMLVAGIEIPPGLVVDHMCKNIACQNPRHLRLVTQAENCRDLAPNSVSFRSAAQTHCPTCHLPYAGTNLAIRPAGKRATAKRGMRVCLNCWPTSWRWAVEPRNPPPGSRLTWLGPFQPNKGPK